MTTRNLRLLMTTKGISMLLCKTNPQMCGWQTSHKLRNIHNVFAIFLKMQPTSTTVYASASEHYTQVTLRNLNEIKCGKNVCNWPRPYCKKRQNKKTILPIPVSHQQAPGKILILASWGWVNWLPSIGLENTQTCQLMFLIPFPWDNTHFQGH